MRQDIEYLIQQLNGEEIKRREGKVYDRELIAKLDQALYMLNKDLPERTGMFENFLSYSKSQQAYIAYIIINQGE